MSRGGPPRSVDFYDGRGAPLPRGPRRRRRRSLRSVPLRFNRRSQIVLVLAAVATLVGFWREQGGALPSVGPGEVVAASQIYVVDGDTVHINGEKIRS